MTGTVQIKKGRPNYYIVLDYVDETTGKRKRPWITTDIPVKGNNKRLANAKLKEVLAEYETQNVNPSKDALFIDFMRDWLETLALSKSISLTTYDAYMITLNTHVIPYFEPKRLKIKDIEPAHIQQYVNKKLESLSPNTVKKHIANISKCLDSAVRQNIIAFNPSTRIEPIKKVKFTGAKFYNEKQIEQLLECSKGDPLEVVILLTLFYGLRRSEVLGLKWKAIDFESNTIAINHAVVKVNKVVHMQDLTKNDSSNAVLSMPDIIKSKLLKWKNQQKQNKAIQPNDYVDEGYICTQVDGSLIKPDYVSQHFSLLLAKNGMPHVRFHDLRHSSASYLKYLGFDPKDIQTWLRHADIQTTMNLYTHLDMTAKKEIADGLEQRFKNFGM